MSNTYFVQSQRRLLSILDDCAYMTEQHLEIALNDLMGTTRRMVTARRFEETAEIEVPVVYRTVTPERPERPRSPIGPPPVMRTAPQFVEIREVPRPAAELRSAAVAYYRTAVPTVPSVLMQEIHATSAAVEAPLAWPERWETYPNLNKFRAIGRVKFNSDCKEACSVCLDTHKNHNAVTTDCGHKFCKQCWYNWMSNATGNQMCPCCRKRRPRTTTFKLMADRKKREEEPQPIQMF